MTQKIVGLGIGPNTGTGDPGYTAFTSVNQNFTELYVGGSFASVAAPATDVQIQAAINTLSAAGGGVVYLGAGTFTLNNPVTLKAGVSIIGVPPSFTFSVFLTASWVPVGGTQIAAGTAAIGFKCNNTATTLTNGVGTFPANGLDVPYGLTGQVYKNLLFLNFPGGGLMVGGQNQPGFTFCKTENIWARNCGAQGVTSYLNQIPNIYLQNFSDCYFKSIYTFSIGGGGGGGGAWFTSSITPSATDIVGNSTIDDVQVYGASYYSRNIVIGNDPNTPGAGLDMMTVRQVASYTGLIAAVTDTPTFSLANTNIGVLHVERWPVGMPCLITGTPPGGPFGVAAGGIYYFVLSNPGGIGAGNITLGIRRGGTALQATGSIGAGLTLSHVGFEQLHLGGNGTSGVLGLAGSTITGCDLEGPLPLYMEGVSNSYVEILTQFTPTYISGFTGLSANTPNNILRNCGTGNTMKASSVIFDGGTSQVGDNSSLSSLIFTGEKKQSPLGYFNVAAYNPTGFYYDSTLQAPVFSLNPVQKGGNPDLYIAGSGQFLAASTMIGQPVNTLTATVDLAGFVSGGFYSCDQAGAATYQLPLMTNANKLASIVGMLYEFCSSGGAGAAIIVPHLSTFVSGQYFNNDVAKTVGITLPANSKGAAAIVRGAVTSGGVTYWAVLSLVGGATLT